MAASHKGAISFGLVHIPVALHTATQDNDIHFNQLCKEDGSRIKYKKVCSHCGKEVTTSDIVKGFEFAKDQYVTMKDDDFVVCGYIRKSNHMTSLVLGQYDQQDRLIYMGHVTLGVSGQQFKIIESQPRAIHPPFDVPKGNENAVWLAPNLVCTVKYMERTANGGMRQPVFKGLREDKICLECKFNFHK